MSYNIFNLSTPVNASDPATKGYVDSVSTGGLYKGTVRGASVADLAATYSGVGKTLTSNSNEAFVRDGITYAQNELVLVKDQTTGSENGIYTVTTVGSGAAAWVLTRHSNFNVSSEAGSGATVFVSEGTLNESTVWAMTTADPITLDTTALVFRQISQWGAKRIKRTTTAGDYTVLPADEIVAVTSTAAARTITLPAVAAVKAGKTYTIKDESGGAGTNNITIEGDGAETIDGSANKVINSNYGSATVYTEGTTWFVI